MQRSAISWTTETWNPVSGCSKVSDGCKFCYAMTLSAKYGWTTKPWTIQNEAENVVMKPHKLYEPYKLKEPSRVFVNSMSDLHHRTFPDWYRAVVWIVMLDLPQHVFQVLTKRSESLPGWEERFLTAIQSPEFDAFRQQVKDKRVKAALYKSWSTPWADHIWQGVSVEDSRVLKRLDDLRASGAKVKFVSAEPLLGAWGNADVTGLDWIIVGGESGTHMKEGNERWMQQEWAREIKRLCINANVAFFYKQDSGYKTELRPWLVEEDGSKWRWHQFPGDLLAPPIRLDDKGEPLQTPFATDLFTDAMEEPACTLRALHFSNEANAYAQMEPEHPWLAANAWVAAQYWRTAAARAVTTPILPDPEPPPPATLERWEAAGRPGNMLAMLALERAAQKPLYAGYVTDPIDYDWGSEPRDVFITEPDPPPLRDEDFIDPPTVNHPDQWDENDCDADAYGEDPEAIALAPPPPKPMPITFQAGDSIWIEPHTPGEAPITGVYLRPDERQAGWLMLELHYPSGKRSVGMHHSAVHTGSPPQLLFQSDYPPSPSSSPQTFVGDGTKPVFAVGSEVYHVGEKLRGVIRRIDGGFAHVQVYGPEGLVEVRDPNGELLLGQWLIRHLRPFTGSWWVDENHQVFRDDHPSADVLARCFGPYDSEADALASVRHQWVQAPDAETAARILAMRLDQATGDPAITDMQLHILHNTVDKNTVKTADAPPSTEGDSQADIFEASEHVIPFGAGERLVVRRSTSAFQLSDFMPFDTLAPGTRVWFIEPFQRDYVTYALCTLSLLPEDRESRQFALSMAVLGPEPQPGDVLRFADQWGSDIEISEYRCDRAPMGDSTGFWSHRAPGQAVWQPVGNPDMRQRLDLGLHPDPDHAVPLPAEALPESHTITLHTAQMGVTDPDMIDITVKSASTPEGKALAPTWDMVQRMTPDQYTPAYYRLIRSRFQRNPQPFIDLLKRERVVMKCYCAPGDWCHRHLALDLLTNIARSIGITVINGGEVVRARTPDIVKTSAQGEQLSMFDLMSEGESAYG